MSSAARRVVLVPSSPAHILGLVDDEASFAEIAGFSAATGLRSFFVSEDVSPEWLASLREGGGADPWRWGFFVVERTHDVAIGTAGFKGPPDERGCVEIAYGIAPNFQGRGYATEAAEALIDFARRDDRVSIIRAHTLPERNASTRVLEKCGFAHAGSVMDPDDGQVWRWERAAELA